jgi:hypothetical protein
VDSARIADRPDVAPDTRARLHAMWAAVAPAWEQHAAYADARGAGIGETMLDLVTPEAGERVLELACGGGGVGLAAAADLVLGKTDRVPAALVRGYELGEGDGTARELVRDAASDLFR